MSLEKVKTSKAPAPIGPYNQAIIVENKFIYTSGQIPLVIETGKVVEGDIKNQTELSIKYLEQILLEAGSSLKSVIKTTVFLKDMNDFAAMNEVYSKYFSASAPARSAVEVARLPRDVRVEIEAVALKEK